MGSLRNAYSRLDLTGIPIPVFFKGQTKYRTTLGSTLTIIIYIFFLMFALSKIGVYLKGDLRIHCSPSVMIDLDNETKTHSFIDNFFEFKADLEFLGIFGETKQVPGLYKSLLWNPSYQREIYQTTVVES